MARKVKFPPTIHHHKTSGQAFIRWQGKDYYLGKFGSREVEAKYATMIAELQVGKRPGESSQSLSVSQVIDAWRANEEPRLSVRGQERKQFNFSLLPLLTLFGKTPASDFDADRLEAVQLAMARGDWYTPEQIANRPKLPPGKSYCLSRKIVNQRIGRIKTVWRWAERKKLVPTGSWGNLRTLPGLRANDPRVRHLPRRTAASEADMRAVAKMADPMGRVAIELLWWTGMRPGELRPMRLADIDRSDPGCWLYRPREHKNDFRGHERIVCLGTQAIAVLSDWLARRDDWRVDEPVFAFRRGQEVRKESICRIVQRAAVRAGRPGFSLYALRHAAKSRATRAFGLDHARAMLGQTSLETTNDYDRQIDLGMAGDVARKIG